MAEIINPDFRAYQRRWGSSGPDRWNGAYYYAREIERNIIPKVETDRSWVLVNQPTYGFDHSIVFIHNNLDPSKYSWLREFDDCVLVCGVPDTVEKVAHLGHAVYLPLSVDLGELEPYKRKTHRGTAFVGRLTKAESADIPEGTRVLTGLPREELLKEMAKLNRVYAVGRCAIEAKVLGCKVLPYDPRFPDPEFWKVMDNSEAAALLQGLLDEIDG